MQQIYDIFFLFGKVAEWSNAVAWKAAVVKATAGSNPVLSAKKRVNSFFYLPIFIFVFY